MNAKLLECHLPPFFYLSAKNLDITCILSFYLKRHRVPFAVVRFICACNIFLFVAHQPTPATLVPGLEPKKILHIPSDKPQFLPLVS